MATLIRSPTEIEAAGKKTAYLAGANLSDIHDDPFELTDLRRTPCD